MYFRESRINDIDITAHDIDLTAHDITTTISKNSLNWIPNLHLTMSDKNTILHPAGWLTDTIIDAAQKLLKQQFPHIQGLQQVALGLTMSFEMQSGEFLQILHCNNHWFTVSSMGSNQTSAVNVFDSMYDSIPALGKAQIACLLKTSNDSILVNIMRVQKQVSYLMCVF